MKDFDHDDPDAREKLLDNWEVKVTWCDGLYAGWYLGWKHGTVGLGFTKEQEAQARHAGAIFVHLWLKGVDVGLATDLAVCYVVRLVELKQSSQYGG